MDLSPLKAYLSEHGLQVLDKLGDGKDGDVYLVDRPSAIKCFRSENVFRRELRAYRILSEIGLDSVAGFKLPRMIASDEAKFIIEMTIVSAPFIVDFASAYDELELERLGFSEEVWDEREDYWSEVFGADWPSVRGAR